MCSFVCAQDPWKAYGQSKTANIYMANVRFLRHPSLLLSPIGFQLHDITIVSSLLCAQELNRRFASLGVTGHSLHPVPLDCLLT